MSIKHKVLGTAAMLALFAGGAAVSASTPASAATPSCGGGCVDIFNHDFGTTQHPAFVLDTFKQGEKTGQPQILFRVSNSDPAEDYTVSYQGLVSEFYAAGLVSAQLDLHYGGGIGTTSPDPTFPDDLAFEVQYSPYGVDSGLCTGVAATAVAGEGVTLQPCGVSSKTIWVVDLANLSGNAGNFSQIGNFLVPLINGSDTNFSQPYVLTYPKNGYPTDSPRPQLYVTNLTGAAAGTPTLTSVGTVDSSQLFSAGFGVLAP